MRSKYIVIHVAFVAVVAIMLLTACATTDKVPEGEKLYAGIKKIEYADYQKSEHAISTREELEVALECPPNGSMFGSSYYRSPFPLKLWIWNMFSDSESKFGKWMVKSFGKAPVLMSNVKADLRASVAQSVLKSHGYFRGNVTAQEWEMSHPKKAKVLYNVEMGHLFTVDTLEYVNFPEEAKRLIDSTAYDAKVFHDVPFNVSTLDQERARITSLFRNNGYYYYQPGYASYLADTFAVPGKVQLKLQMADSLPPIAMKKMYLGKVEVNLRRTYRETLDNTMADYFKQLRDSGKGPRRTTNTADRPRRQRLTVNFSGKKPPLRMRVLTKDMTLRPGELYDYSKYLESSDNLSTNGLFSSVDFRFTPRDSTEYCDTIDLSVNCVFDKPYDFYVETNLKGKTTGFIGPQLIVGLTKRNAFHGGENLDINLHGSYEWQTGHTFDSSSSDLNSYEYGGDASLTYPRFLLPWRVRKRFYSTPYTILKASGNIVNRSGFFKRHIVSGELTYELQTAQKWRHRFTPLSVEYNYLNKGTDRFYELLNQHPYLAAVMLDVFIPKMKYTVTFSTRATSRNPVFWETSVSESANLLSLAYTAAGREWAEKEKQLFKNPYAQFFKVESDFTKTWYFSEDATLVGHLNAGLAWAYGNSSYMPYTECFWVGGANSVRAFNVRSIGPGAYRSEEKRWRFVEQVGEMKLQANLEYRPRLFGKLFGALFLDAGNVWSMSSGAKLEGSKFKAENFLDQLAVGTGFGIRYDLDFFVIRLDWGIAIHAPYDTGKSGYYNISSFGDGQSFHFAIGYPF